MVPIDKSYWENHYFEAAVGWQMSANQEKERMHTVGGEKVFYNLKVDTRQVERCWPRQKRFGVQWPIKWESV